jgi:NADPH:quinone reductase
MRAFAVLRFGEAPAIHDLPIPSAGDTFLIRVTCAGVNPIDCKRLDQLTAASTYPFVAGWDFAGVLESVPHGEPDLHAGDRVFGMARTHGSYAEYTAVEPGAQAEAVAAVTDGVTDEQAAALPIPAITALGSLDLLQTSMGQRLVLMGGAGAVGGYAVQIARSRGAHVIATVRGDTDEARRLGADVVYDSSSVDVIDVLRSSHPDGVDAVLDLVNRPEALRRDAEILKPGGRLVTTLYAADEAWFAGRDITANNISSSTNPLSSRHGLNEIARMLANGIITARIGSTVDFDSAAQLLETLRSGGLRGKAIIRL